METAYLVTRWGGTTVTAGLSPIAADFSFKQSMLVSEEKTIKGSYMGSCVPVRDIPRFIALYQQGKLPVDRMVSERIGFDELNVGFDRLQDVATVRQILVPHG
jgi:alcohol dehydrogenase